MSKLEELIEKLCPNGVEYKKLKDIKIVSFWLMPSTPKYEKEGIPYITSKNIKNGELDFDNVNYITEKTYLELIKNRKINSGDILISMIGTIGEVCIVDEFSKFYGQNIYLVRLNNERILNKYYYYYITQLKIKDKLISKKNASSQGYIKAGSIENMSIPVPPIEVQNEIVRILDNFTKLITELITELTKRKQQYEFCEYNLFWNDKYNKVKLSEVCKVNQGLQIPISKRFTEKKENRYLYITVQFLKNKDGEQYYIENPDKNVRCYKDDILVTRTGSTGIIITGVEGCFHNNFFKVECNENINKRYMYYLLKSKRMYNKMLAAASGGTVPDLPHKKFYNLEIPLPTLEEQELIVNILDRFDKLCNDILEGLPAEIERRQKQYEYYRDKLLTFKELKNN